MSGPEEITRHHDWEVRDTVQIWVGGRPVPEPVVIVESDTSWPASYDTVAALIRSVKVP